MDDAIATAIERFKRDRGLSCWSALADGYEVLYERKTTPIAGDRGAGAAAGGLEARPAGDLRRPVVRPRALVTLTGAAPRATLFWRGQGMPAAQVGLPPDGASRPLGNAAGGERVSQ